MWKIVQSIYNNLSGRVPWKFVVLFFFLNLLNICLFSCPKNNCALVKVPVSRVLVKSRVCHTGKWR